MSLFSGSRMKEKDKDLFGSKKCQFYVEFLGWMECRGLQGEQYTQPVIKELHRRQKKMDTPPKLTLQVSRKDIKVSQDCEDKKKRNIKKIKFPTIPSRDVTYAVQSRRPDGRPDDIVACIYLGFMPRTQKYVHVHVYRFDEPETAATFVNLLSQIVDMNRDRIHEEELKLVNWGEIDNPRLNLSNGFSDPNDSATGSNGSNYSGDDSPTYGSDEIDSDLQSLKDVKLYDSVADELRSRLGLAEVKDKGPPILLPPKDYDTISRAQGNLIEIEKRRCLQLNIIGGANQQSEPQYGHTPLKLRNSSGESGIDLHSPSSSENSSRPAIFSSGNTSPTTPPALSDFVYPPRSPRVDPTYAMGGRSNDHTPLGGRLSGPAYSGYTHRSDGSRHSSRHSDERDDDDVYPFHLKSPPQDYQMAPDDFVEMRRPGGFRNHLAQSMPSEALQRELDFVDHRKSYESPIQLRRTQQPDPKFLDVYDRRPGNFQVRRVNSMYR